MKNKFYMKECLHFNGEDFVTFNILDVDELKHEICVVVTTTGKISVATYPLLNDEDGLYFEYGPSGDKIDLNKFEGV